MRDYASLFDELLSDLGPLPHASDRYVSDQSVGAAAKAALASSFYKKLCPEGNTPDADAAALEKFLGINASVSRGPFEFIAESEAESCFWDYFLNEVELMTDQRPFGQSFDMEFIRDHMGVGPGAAQKANAQDMMTKLFGGPVSYTDTELIRLYRGALAGAGFWAEAEMQRYSEHGFVKVEGVKIFFAPKNREISRTCGTESVLGMLIQKGIGAFLEQGLERETGINLSTQPDLNRELARQGSDLWESSDSFCTIDLVSASDCISLALTKRIIRNPVLRHAILVSRSQFAVLPDGKRVELNMVSTMGNGFTFPLQTLIFASAVRACYHVMGIPLHRDGIRNYGVFGDDIVVRKPAYDFIIRMLSKLGFVVNKEKSFCSGPFRESCGHDYFKGGNIRGVYVQSCETHPEVYSVINRLLRWSTWHGISVNRTVGLLRSWLHKIHVVPPSETDDAGIHVPFELTRPKLTAEYWFKYRKMQRVVERVDIPEIEEWDPKSSDLATACGFLSGIYRRRDIAYLTDDDVQSSPWEWGWSASVSLRDTIGVRARYKVVEKTLPFWDYVPVQPHSTESATAKKCGGISRMQGPWHLGSDTESYTSWRQVVADALRR